MILRPAGEVTLPFHQISVGSEVRQWNGKVPRSRCRQDEVEMGVQTNLYDQEGHRNREIGPLRHDDRDSHKASRLRNDMVRSHGSSAERVRARSHDRRRFWRRERWSLGGCRMVSLDVRLPTLPLLESVKASRERGCKVIRPKIGRRPTKPLVSKLSN